jgi:hypothetical protein
MECIALLLFFAFHSLDISSHGIQNSGCISIINAAMAGKITNLVLGQNHIGERGVAAVRNAIEQVRWAMGMGCSQCMYNIFIHLLSFL